MSDKIKKKLPKKSLKASLIKDYEEKIQIAVAQLQKTQQQLIQSEKMASLGTIAAGVAHEINNPLSFLLSNVESLEIYMKTFNELLNRYDQLIKTINPNLFSVSSKKLFKEIELFRNQNDVVFILDDYQSLLKESLEGVFRIREIVQSLQTFSRTYGEELQLVDLNDCISTALRVVSNELKYKCALSKDYGDIPRIYCNPGHLLQVFMNILLNAAQSIAERGKISIKTFSDDKYVYAKITDSGCGISDENKQKLFTPFFTTKPIGQGTGLGLSVSYGIIRALDGQIEVDSKVGIGSIFTIKIPYAKIGDI